MKTVQRIRRAGSAILLGIVAVAIFLIACVAFIGGEKDEKTGADLS